MTGHWQHVSRCTEWATETFSGSMEALTPLKKGFVHLPATCAFFIQCDGPMLFGGGLIALA